MARKFKAKRRVRLSKIIKWVFILFAIFVMYKCLKWSLLTVDSFDSNEKFIKYILEDNDYYSYSNKKGENILNTVVNYISNNIIQDPLEVLNTNFYYRSNNEASEKYIADNDEQDSNKPLVYIYNSHQTESYSMEYLEDYNINPTVQMTAYILKEKLGNLGIDVVVEDANISSYLKENNMKYSQSYEASRYYLKQVIDRYDGIVLYLDVHRDAIDHDSSTVNINGLDCAKIMFVVGKEYDTYLSNLENTNHLNDMIKEKYPDLTRGVIQKEGKNVNGVYNQDLSPNIMLLEIGGNYNNISEVLNTIDLITPIIGEYINEKK